MSTSQNQFLEIQIRSCYNNLTKAEKRVADYIHNHMDSIASLSAQQIGEGAQTGAATVVRFCRSCGFVGLSDLKASLQREKIILDRPSSIDVSEGDTIAAIKQKVLGYHATVIDGLRLQKNEEALEAAVNAILGAHRIVISGMGDSSAMAIILNNNLDMQGWETYYSSDHVQELAHINRLQRGDILIAFSYTGRFGRVIKNFEIAKSIGATTIGILGHRSTPGEPFIDICLYTSAEHTEYSFGSQASLIGDFAIIEILTTILASRRNSNRAHVERMQDLLEMHRIPKEED